MLHLSIEDATRDAAVPYAPPAAPRLAVHAVGPHDAARPELEAFVRNAFDRKHAARVESFMPTLLSFRDGSDRLRGVLGLRAAALGPLYLEHYLDVPIERAIAARTTRAVSRNDVVEVGNLAGASHSAAVRIVSILPDYLLQLGFRWITFTATRAVRDILATLEAPTIELAQAREACVATAPDDWGRYYTTDPRVVAGHLPDARALSGFARSAT